MKGNIFFGLEMIAFVFLFAVVCFRKLKVVLKEAIKKNEEYELQAKETLFLMALLISFLAATLTTSFYCLEPVYFSNKAVYWFIFFSIANTMQIVFCNVVQFIDRKTAKFFES